MLTIFVQIIISLISGILGVILTIFFQRRFMLYDLKREVLFQFVESRYDLLGENFTKALNKVNAVYVKDKSVIEAVDEFHSLILSQTGSQDKTNQKLYQIYLTMCKSIKIKPMGETNFLTPFNTKNDTTTCHK